MDGNFSTFDERERAVLDFAIQGGSPTTTSARSTVSPATTEPDPRLSAQSPTTPDSTFDTLLYTRT